MNLFIRCTAFVLFYTIAIESNAQNLSFGSAEERIVYNKQNQLPRYEGVQIAYSFLLKTEAKQKTEQELKAMVSEPFPDALSLTIETQADKWLLVVLTEGDLRHHEAYEQTLQQHSQYFEKQPRNYILK